VDVENFLKASVLPDRKWFHFVSREAARKAIDAA
jgi:hypothetical protein